MGLKSEKQMYKSTSLMAKLSIVVLISLTLLSTPIFSHHLLTEYLQPTIAKAAETPNKQTYNFAVFAYLGKEETEKKYRPIVDYLNETLEYERIELLILSQEEIDEGIEKGEIDFVTTNPTHFLILRKDNSLTGVIATLVGNENGQSFSKLGGVIVTLASRDEIQTLEDIRGKVIAAPSYNHMGGYRAQAYELFQIGIRLPQDASDVMMLESDHNVIYALLEEKADVGFVRNGILESMYHQGELHPQEIKVINKQMNPNFPHQVSTALYPEWPVFALPHVKENVVRGFASALYALTPDHPAAIEAQIDGYTVSEDYLSVEELARDLRIAPFDKAPEFTLSDAWDRWQTMIVIGLAAVVIIILLSIVLLVVIQRIKQTQRKLNSVMDGIGEGVYGIDLAGNCTFINPVALHMLGFTREEVIGHDQHRLFHHHYSDGCIYPIQECPIYIAIKYNQKFRLEEWFFRKDGQGFPVQLTVTPLRKNNQIIGAVVIFQDITERKQAEKKIISAMKEAEQANQSKSLFLAMMSHEIRTPMNAILGMTELLDEIAVTNEQKEYMEILKNNGNNLLHIINDVLDLSKIEAGKTELEIKSFNPYDLINEVYATFLPLTANGVSLAVNTNLSNPNDFYILGDKEKIRQILVNLVGNALKFTEQGSISIKLENIDDQKLQFSVEDTGIGISPEHIKSIFMDFEQEDQGLTRTYGGTGLGLSISRKFSELMGGQLWAESEKGVGSNFYLEIPYEKSKNEDLNNNRANQNSSSKIVEIKKSNSLLKTKQERKILLVEDNEDNRSLILAYLRNELFQIDIAEHGQKAIDTYIQMASPINAVDEKPYDVILMDVQMPVKDGLQATEEIRQWEKENNRQPVPIIVLTAHAMEEDRKKSFDVGCNDHITKPIKKDKLLECINKYIL